MSKGRKERGRGENTREKEVDKHLAGMFIAGRLLLGVGGVIVGAIGPVLVAELAYPGKFSHTRNQMRIEMEWEYWIK